MFAKHTLNKGFRFRVFTSYIPTVNLYPEYIKNISKSTILSLCFL